MSTAAERRIERARRAATVALQAVHATRELVGLVEAPPAPTDPTKKGCQAVRLLAHDRKRLQTALEAVKHIHALLELDARKIEEWERGGRLEAGVT